MVARLALFYLLLLGTRGVFKLAGPLGPLPSMTLAYGWLTLVTGVFWIRGWTLAPIPFGVPTPRQVFVGVGAGLGIFLAGLLGYIFSQNVLRLKTPPEALAFRPTTALDWILLALVLVLTVVGEEMAFRGILAGALRSHLSTVWVVLLTTLLFTAYHLSVFQIASTMVYGIVLTWLALHYNSLWPSLAAHFVLNGLGILLSLLQPMRTPAS